eukprot:UN30654
MRMPIRRGRSVGNLSRGRLPAPLVLGSGEVESNHVVRSVSRPNSKGSGLRSFNLNRPHSTSAQPRSRPQSTTGLSSSSFASQFSMLNAKAAEMNNANSEASSDSNNPRNEIRDQKALTLNLGFGLAGNNDGDSEDSSNEDEADTPGENLHDRGS